jgi:hypothetical protein
MGVVPLVERLQPSPQTKSFFPNWKNSKYIQQFFERDQPGKQTVYGPLLLVGGDDDIFIYRHRQPKDFSTTLQCRSTRPAERLPRV